MSEKSLIFNYRVQITRLSDGLKIEKIHPDLITATNWIIDYMGEWEEAYKVIISMPKNTNCHKQNQYTRNGNP